MVKIKLPFSLPTLNEILATAKMQRRNYSPYNKQKSELMSNIKNISRRQFRSFKSSYRLLKFPVEVAIKWICTNRRADPDNIAFGKKFVLDGLTEANILENDGWKQIASFEDTFAVGEPGVIVELRRPRAEVLRELIKPIFEASSVVSQTRNIDPTFEQLERTEQELDRVMWSLIDMLREDEDRMTYLEKLIYPEREKTNG